MKRFGTIETPLKGRIVVTLEKCPRCKRFTLIGSPNEALNALSRRGDYYICSTCGTDEAMEDYLKQEAK